MSALDLLPHGPEFRFLDRVLELDPGKSGQAIYEIKGTEPFLHGHFPNNPIFPGVLLVESVAQLAGVVAQSDPAVAPLQDLKLTAIKGAKILGSALPGEQLRIEAAVAGRMGGLVQARGKVLSQDRLILECDVVLSGREPDAS